jgi:hypothetical protein
VVAVNVVAVNVVAVNVIAVNKILVGRDPAQSEDIVVVVVVEYPVFVVENQETAIEDRRV